MARPVFEIETNLPTLAGVLEEFPVAFAAEYIDKSMFTASKIVLDRLKAPDYIWPDRTGLLRSTVKRQKVEKYNRQFTNITIGSPRTREYAPVVLFHEPFDDYLTRRRREVRGRLRRGRFGRRRSARTIRDLLGGQGLTSPRTENPLQQALSESRTRVGQRLVELLDRPTVRKIYNQLREKQRMLERTQPS